MFIFTVDDIFSFFVTAVFLLIVLLCVAGYLIDKLIKIFGKWREKRNDKDMDL